MLFSNHNSVFLQILHCSPVSCKTTPLYFFRSNVAYFHRRNQSKCKFLRLSSAQSKFTKFLLFMKQEISFSSNFASLFIVIRHNSSVLFWLKFYTLLAKRPYPSTNLVKFHASSKKSEILHFNGLLLSK